jgi:hypothetical protein
MLCISNCIADSVWFAIPQPTEWQHIGDQIDAAFIIARANLLGVRGAVGCSAWLGAFFHIAQSVFNLPVAPAVLFVE